ncbi:MAG: MBOAT family O-acyltransferase [candidate division Zixibacteria bacterium]
MNFATVSYLIFFAVVFIVYWHLRHRFQNIFLLGASYLFYAAWDWRFLSLIIISTLTDYISGHMIYRSDSALRRKIVLIISLVINLSLLGYFKYFNFFADSFITLANSVGWNVSWTAANIILPVGISFYTFQSISYTVDIYRKKLKPTASLIDFAAFVAFFPQLVAGPIVRAREFVFQLEAKRVFNTQEFEAGLRRFLFGFFKKAFIADTLAMHLVEPAFANPTEYSGATLWLALIGWTFQIYADFSGYSSMAIGSAKMLGFKIPENFDFPYLSRNISQYWQRWHKTMSRFFRDYVYIGLGGNRRGLRRSLINITITTFVSGLWHGAGWTFVTWGLLHGFYIAVFQTWRKWRKDTGRWKDNPGITGIILAWILTQLAICLSRILFRSPDFSTAWNYTKGIVLGSGSGTIEVPFLVWVAFGAIVIDHIFGWFLEHRPHIKDRVPGYVKVVVYVAMILFLSNSLPDFVNPYIYFQF